MGRRLTQEAKIDIIRRYEKGDKAKTIRRELCDNGLEVTRRQIEHLIKQYVKGYFRTDMHTTNAKPTIAVAHRDMEIVSTSLTANPDQSARDLRRQLLQDGSKVSLSTVKRVIKRCGFTSDVPRYSHMVRFANQQPRVEFCNMLINTNDTLDDIIFTDESSVQLHNNKSSCYRPIGKGNRQLPKPKHPLKVHVWAGISRRGATPIFIFEGIMDSEFYTSNILGNVLVPFIQETYPDRHRLCQDNDPKHRSKFTRRYMEDQGINWWNIWPSGKFIVYINKIREYIDKYKYLIHATSFISYLRMYLWIHF